MSLSAQLAATSRRVSRTAELISTLKESQTNIRSELVSLQEKSKEDLSNVYVTLSKLHNVENMQSNENSAQKKTFEEEIRRVKEESIREINASLERGKQDGRREAEEEMGIKVETVEQNVKTLRAELMEKETELREKETELTTAKNENERTIRDMTTKLELAESQATSLRNV